MGHALCHGWWRCLEVLAPLDRLSGMYYMFVLRLLPAWLPVCLLTYEQ